MIIIVKSNFQRMLKVVSQLNNPLKKFATLSQILCFQIKTIGVRNLVYARVFLVKVTQIDCFIYPPILI